MGFPCGALARPSPETPTQRLAQLSDVLLPELPRYTRARWGSGSSGALRKVTRGHGLIAVSAATETDEDGSTLETPRPPTVDYTSGESVELPGNPSQLAEKFRTEFNGCLILRGEPGMGKSKQLWTLETWDPTGPDRRLL